MSKKKEHDKMVEITEEIQEFLQKQLLKVDNPLMLAGCFAAQVRNLYVVLCGYETTYKVYSTMLDDLRKEMSKKGTVTHSDEKATIH